MYRSFLENANNEAPAASISIEEAQEIIQNLIKEHNVVIFTLSNHEESSRAVALLKSFNEPFAEIVLDKRADGRSLRAALAEAIGEEVLPLAFADEEALGTTDQLVFLNSQNELYARVRSNNYQYDLVVMGGGSGGLAAAKQAALLGARVCAIDYVDPTPTGTKWGLGGTCVNVGCIPKKLMHQAALLRESINDMASFGWQTEKLAHAVKQNWSTLVENVNAHIKSLNWKYRVDLRQQNVEYINGFASFIDKHTVETRTADGKTRQVTGKYILVATGVRPTYPDIPNAREFAITSDDLFQLPREPGRTVVIGASYVALECAGFLAAFGYDVAVMVRSILLRGFDQQMANLVGDHLESCSHPVQLIRECVPTSFERLREGNSETGELPLYKVTGRKNDGTEVVQECNTILLAIGRSARTAALGIGRVGVKAAKDGKLIVDDEDRTNVPHIFAIGDVASGRPELTPPAIEAGQLLAQRLFKASTTLTDYVNIPTTIFTPLEYGACGYSEEAAIEKFGEENVEVYHTQFTPLEWTLPSRGENACYIKLVCLLPDEKVIGFHCVSPNAGEITQGYAVAMKAGVTKAQVDATIGIHPTCAENFTTLTITKRSGQDAAKKGC